MRTPSRTAPRVAVTASLLTIALGAVAYGGSSCGGSPNASGSSPASSGQAQGACKLTAPPTSAAQAPPATTAGKASGKVGVILPDTTSSTRYTLYDAPLLKSRMRLGDLALARQLRKQALRQI